MTKEQQQTEQAFLESGGRAGSSFYLLILKNLYTAQESIYKGSVSTCLPELLPLWEGSFFFQTNMVNIFQINVPLGSSVLKCL